MTVFHSRAHPRRGERCSAAAAYLEPALADPMTRLQVVTHAHSRRVVWAHEEAGAATDPAGAASISASSATSAPSPSPSSPPRAVGVEFVWNERELRVARARKEVVLCAGAIESPHLLQQSGVGHPAQLAAAGITPVHALPGVGQNLQDHLELYQSYECVAPVSLSPHLGLLRKGMVRPLWGSHLESSATPS